mmetsp:Transcript_3647/g.7536  ORF Transcript_3647/g.7536 Transcript_3647/m.7536 type:complete len:211 (-) Transcript_3647:703-1335(-)
MDQEGKEKDKKDAGVEEDPDKVFAEQVACRSHSDNKDSQSRCRRIRGVLPPGAFGGGTGTGGPSPMGAAPNGTGSRTPPSVGMHVRASLVVRTGSFGPQKVLKLNKGTYRGHTWMGKPLGPGSLYYPSSVVFLGEFESSGRLLGVYTYPNGHILRGSFRPWTNTLEVTQQTMVYQNGTLYRGTIIGGEISGKGTARYSDGSIYKGRFRKV